MDQRKKGTKPPFFINNSQGQPTSREPRMIEIGGQSPRQPPIQCWGCKGDHMFRDCPHRGENFNEMVKSCLMDMNGLNTRADLNIFPLGSYDCLIGMDWLDQHHAILGCHNKAFTCLDEEGNVRKVQGILREVTIREILALQLKKCYRKGCQIFVVYMEETPKDKVPNLEDHAILEYFEDVFKEVPGLPPKRDNDFSINLISGVAPVLKTPYKMSTP
jgi:hypothetical protein